MFGLYGSPYRAEEIAAMRREIGAADHPVTQEFLDTLAGLQIGADPAWDPGKFDGADAKAGEAFWRAREAHVRELVKAGAEAAVAALPRKVASARAVTVEFLATSSDLLGPEAAGRARKELAAVWGELPERERLELIQYRWAAIGGPEMLPVLKAFVSGPAPLNLSEAARARDEALKHIVQLSPGEGRALILRDLRDPGASPSIELAKLVPADEVREVAREAAARIESGTARDVDYFLVERYGDRAGVAGVARVLAGGLGRWACEPQAAMLRYVLKFDAALGTEMVETALAARKTTGCYRTLLLGLGSSLQKVEPAALGALDDGDLEVAKGAAEALGAQGPAKAEDALWERLKRFHAEWKDREGELRFTPDFESPVARAAALEGALVSSIAMGANWLCGPAEFERLRGLASPGQRARIAEWSMEWERNRMVRPSWFLRDGPRFDVLYYSGLDEEQLWVKLSQLPKGMRLKFPVSAPERMSPPVSEDRQEAEFRRIREYAGRFGVVIERASDP